MSSFSAFCPTRRTSLFSWFFGGPATTHNRLTVDVSYTHKHDRNRIVQTSYNLRPRRTRVNYKEPPSDAEDSDTASDA